MGIWRKSSAREGANGWLTSITDADGKVSTIVYNAARQKTADIDQTVAITSYTYEAIGRPETVKNARGYVTTTVYNARDITATVDALNNRTSFSYDNVGRRTAVEDANGHFNTTVYEDAGQVNTTVDGSGNRTTMQLRCRGASDGCAESRWHPLNLHLVGRICGARRAARNGELTGTI